ncbi:MAG: ATP synthase F1 subunit delta [Flavobacterium sp.]|nr:MAG: ATP synthase F1 subunit delta [Flavobacterium sp.]
MAGTRAALRYAKAILETAHDKGVAAEVNTDMSLVAVTVKGNEELSAFLASPVIGAEAKRNVLEEVFSSVSPVTKSLFRLLFENRRFEILGDLAKGYNTLFDEMSGIEVAKVTTAVPMDAEMESKVHARILTFTNKKVIIENIVDPTIIGGFILRMGDRQYNASLANRLLVLKRELLN